MSKPVKEKCKLCKAEAELQCSHVVPRYVWKWLRRTGITHHMRSSADPNQRQQDGPKRRWLCTDCEQKLSKWENRFKKEVFEPATKVQKIGPYSGRGMLCALSILWRVGMQMCEHPERPKGQQGDARRKVERLLNAWRKELVEEKISPSTKMRLVKFGTTNTGLHGFGGRLNRYLTRYVGVDILWNEAGEICYVWCKLGPIVLIGVVEETPEVERLWVNADMIQGQAPKQNVQLPSALLEPMQNQTRKMEEMQSRMSPRQQAKVTEELQRIGISREKLEKTEQGRAMLADIRMYGRGAAEIGGTGKVVVRTQIRTLWRRNLEEERMKRSCVQGLRHFVEALSRGSQSVAGTWTAMKGLVETSLFVRALSTGQQEGANPRCMESTIVLRREAGGNMSADWWDERPRKATKKEARELDNDILQVSLWCDEINLESGDRSAGEHWFAVSAKTVEHLAQKLISEEAPKNPSEAEENLEKLMNLAITVWINAEWLGRAGSDPTTQPTATLSLERRRTRKKGQSRWKRTWTEQ